MTAPQLQSIQIKGYKAFKDFQASLGSLTVLVGANGSGKTSLFEFLKFIRDGLREIPPEIVPGTVGQKIFRDSSSDPFDYSLESFFEWNLELLFPHEIFCYYQGGVSGPIGKPSVVFENVIKSSQKDNDRIDPLEGDIELLEIENALLTMNQGVGFIVKDILPDDPDDPFDLSDQPSEIDPTKESEQKLTVNCRKQLALGTITSPDYHTLFLLNEYIQHWCFIDSLSVDGKQISRPVVIRQEPVLNHDAGNLSALLHYLMTEDQSAFQELQGLMRMVIPGFSALTVKARGGPGEVMAFWKEKGEERDIDLSIADMSAGSVRFLCWAALLVQSNPPPLICIDEPDLGLHPRTLALLAGLFEKASAKTQIILTTHSSYFLSQFDVSRVAITKKGNGEAKFIRPSDSKALMANLEEFGEEELELMHRSDELEALS